MLRKSEHIEVKKGTADQATRGHFAFFDSNGNLIPYHMLGNTSAQCVTTNIAFSKTDHSGLGRTRSQHNRQSDGNICTVRILEKYFKCTRDEYGAKFGDPIYAVPGYGRIEIKSLTDTMQATVSASVLGELKEESLLRVIPCDSEVQK